MLHPPDQPEHVARTPATAESFAVTSAEWTLRRIFWGTFAVLGVVLIFLLLYRFYTAVFLLFVAIVLQIALDPLVRRLSARGLNRTAAILLLYLVIFLLLGGLTWYLVPTLAEQLAGVLDDLPLYYQNVRNYLLNVPIGLVRGLASTLPVEPSLPLLMRVSGGESAETPEGSWGWIGITGQLLFGLFAVFAMAFYWTLEGEVILRRLILRTPATRREELRALIGESQLKIGGWFRGQVILSAIMGVGSAAIYFLLGIPNALLLGLIMALTESVPVIGPLLGSIPAVIVTMAEAPDKVLWVVIALIAIETLESNLLVPRVMDESVGINPIISILALAAFGALFGFVGALLAIPLAAILQIIFNRVLFNTPINEDTVVTTPAAPGVSRSRYGVLRLEAQGLMQAVRKKAREDEKQAAEEDEHIHTEDEIEAIATDLDKLLAAAEGAA
jgi:predicted PurR-regulated permease PerM